MAILVHSSTSSIFNSVLKATVLAALGLSIAACTKSENAIPQSAAPQPVVNDVAVATGAPEQKRVRARGGTKIAVLVNNTPITTSDVNRRAAFVRLRRLKGNARTIATNELIDETLKMNEARRIRAVAKDSEVNAAFARFAKSNKQPVRTLAQFLNKQGTGEKGFKQFIRAQISWQRAVSARLQSETSRSSSASTGTQRWLASPGDSTAREQEYTLQQVIFIVPAKDRSRALNGRRTQAKNFRARLRGCSNAKELAAAQRDVTVRDLGRLLESRLPPQWKDDIKAAGQGKVTRTKDTPRGIEMIAVCNTREVLGTQSKSQAELFEGKNFAQAASALDKKYLAELKERATIQRR